MKISEKYFHLVYMVALGLSVVVNVLFMSLEASQTSYRDIRRQYFPPTPRKGPRKLDQAFGGCMLVMDDNHRLTEWLAYHYHVLPLDYLVVATDPNSRTSPKRIFDQWRGYGMTILEWNNTDIYRGPGVEDYLNKAKKNRQAVDHRQRQNMFLRNCISHMIKANRTWVILVDSDEYLLFNGPSGTTKNYANIPYPSVENEGAILTFLEKERRRPKSNITSPCISIPRVMYGVVPSPVEEINRKVPRGFDFKVLDTLKYRKHLRRSVTYHHKLNGWSKSIVDVSRVKESDIPTPVQALETEPYFMNVHQPLPKFCPQPFIKDEETLFRINHYVGSWEAFSYRQDSRVGEGRNREVRFYLCRCDDLNRLS